MKRNTPFILSSTVLAILLTNACTVDDPQTTSVSVLWDVSEEEFGSSTYYPNDLSTLAQFIVADTLKPSGNGGQVRLSALNELSQNTAQIVALSSAKNSGILGPNPFIRKDEIYQFLGELKRKFEDFRKTYKEESQQSKIYQGLCHELNLLVKDSSDQKILIVYSDFLENSSLFTFYAPGKSEFLKDPTQFTDSVLKKNCPLPNLKAIEIYLVAFRTSKNDEAVNKALGFWKSILEHSGAKVKTGVDLASMR